MVRIYSVGLVLFLAVLGLVYASFQEYKPETNIQTELYTQKGIRDYRNRILGLGFNLKKEIEQEKVNVRSSPDIELETVKSWLKTNLDAFYKSGGRVGIDIDTARNLRFFTRYTFPDRLKPIVWDCMSFVVNSTAHFTADTFRYPITPIANTDLAYVDIRNYYWDQKQMEIVSGLDPYFAEPLVYSHEVPGYGRIVNGNLLFRADWAISNWMDTTKQDDRGEKDLIYYILQYGKGNEPKNADEFRKFWKVNINEIREEKLEIGTIVNKGDSGVSRHTRQLRRARTITGYYHETRDVKTHDIDPKTKLTRDYMEDLFANQADALEYIVSNKRGMQVYLLTAGNNDKFKRIESGDNAVVVDRSDFDDVRVRTAKSCVTCHAIGINPSTNKVRQLLLSGAQLKAYSYELRQELKAFYLQNQNTLVEDDNRLYERAMKEVNGLDPIENAKNFVELYNWYNQDVTPEQAALEWGMSVDEFRMKIKATVTGRLVDLYKGFSIPRDTWDSLNAGVYTQAGLLIKRIIIQPKQVVPVPAPTVEIKPPQETKIQPPPDSVITIRNNIPLEAGKGKVFAYIPIGTRMNVIKSEPDWYFVEYNGQLGWVHADYVRKIQVLK